MSEPSFDIVPADGAGIDRAVEALAQGRLILHPTETVVSLSGDPARRETVDRALRVKGYRKSRPFLCLVADVSAARRLSAAWPPAAERLADRFWPGPLTLVVTAGPSAPDPVVREGTLAVRPAVDAVSRRLLETWGGPVFSTSANRHGEPSPWRVREAACQLADAPGVEAIAVALEPQDGTVLPSAGRPSTIVDVAVRPPRIVRLGALDAESLRGVCPDLE